jgi:cytochrome P450
MESPVKSHFRLACKTTSIGDIPIPAGSTVTLLPEGSNRDARKFIEPNEFRVDRPNVREHVAFGRGNHSCLGAPLVRTEGQISLNRILDHMTAIGFPSPCTDLPMHGTTHTNPPGRCAASHTSTSSSTRCKPPGSDSRAIQHRSTADSQRSEFTR